MTDWRRTSRSPVVVVAAGVFLAVLALAWHDYAATLRWERSSEQALQRRADQALQLIASAFVRDMRGAQSTLLAPLGPGSVGRRAVHELQTEAAAAFARFPYLDTIFVWRPDSAGLAVLLSRADRRPRWLNEGGAVTGFPVDVVDTGTPVPAIETAMRALPAGARTTAFEARIDGHPYQVVVRLLYDGELPLTPAGAVGFMVDLDWVRAHYLGDLAGQVADIAGADNELTVAIIDEGGRPLRPAGGVTLGGSVRMQWLPLLFVDPLELTEPHPRWSRVRLEVGLSDDAARRAASSSADRMALFMAAGALALCGALVMTVRAARAQARLSEVRSNFVSTVTHNLKTPVASIRVLGEALARQRARPSDESASEYGSLLIQQTRELSRLLDNLLAYSRVPEGRDLYTFERCHVDELVETTLAGFRPRLTAEQVSVDVAIPDDLPDVMADPAAARLVLENLVDNAIRYAGETKWLGITGTTAGDRVTLTISDHGDGIPADEIESIGRKFYRGRGARSSGSGLGLALSRLIVEDHGGSLALRSVPGVGTDVTIAIPTAR